LDLVLALRKWLFRLAEGIEVTVQVSKVAGVACHEGEVKPLVLFYGEVKFVLKIPVDFRVRVCRHCRCSLLAWDDSGTIGNVFPRLAVSLLSESLTG
jgi:hypothetical protein